MIRAIGAFIFAGAVLLSVRDLFLRGDESTFANAHQSHEPSKSREPPVPRMKKSFMGPTLKFMYCYSCGYKRVYEEFSRLIVDRYPQLVIEGDNYPPLPMKAMIAQFLSTAKLVVLALIIFGQNPLPALGLQTPQFVNWAFQNKIYACMMLFFISNAIENQMMSTGAFEITFNDMPVWSKLEVGRIPSPQELFQILDGQLKFSGSEGGATLRGSENY